MMIDKEAIYYQSTYRHTTTGELFRTIGSAYNKANNTEIILYAPIKDFNGVLFMYKETFLDNFIYVGI